VEASSADAKMTTMMAGHHKMQPVAVVGGGGAAEPGSAEALVVGRQYSAVAAAIRHVNAIVVGTVAAAADVVRDAVGVVVG